MNTDIKVVPTNFQEAYEYVNNRYVFNEENYPVMKNLTTDDQKIIFSLNHCLLHILKNMFNIKKITSYKRTDNGTKILQINTKLEMESFTKIWINIFSILHILYNSKYHFGSIDSLQNELNRFKSVEDYIPEKDLFEVTENFVIHLSRTLEKADHQGFLYPNDSTVTSFFICFINWVQLTS